MSRATETRLSKLEVRAGVAGRRVFIFGAVEPGKAKKRELIACGEATEECHARPAQGLCDRSLLLGNRP